MHISFDKQSYPMKSNTHLSDKGKRLLMKELVKDYEVLAKLEEVAVNGNKNAKANNNPLGSIQDRGPLKLKANKGEEESKPAMQPASENAEGSSAKWTTDAHGSSVATWIKPIAWIHIPKAGTSFLNTLLHHGGICPVFPEDKFYEGIEVRDNNKRYGRTSSTFLGENNPRKICQRASHNH